MKKIILTFAAALVLSAAAFAQGLTATVVTASGKVEVQKGDEWVALKVGDSVQKGAVISTGFKSEAILKINDSNVTLGPLTRMTVEQLASNGNKDQTQLFIDSGKVSANVKHTENKRVDFKVRSPVATASVRGTDFTMSANGTVSTREGLVSKGAAESSRAQVSAAGEASAFTPADGESTAFTPTSAVSESGGVPVFAGQKSTTDAVTGRASSPQAEKFASARSMPGAVASIAQSESAAPAAAAFAPSKSGSAPAAPNPGSRSSGSTSGSTGSISISVTWAD